MQAKTVARTQKSFDHRETIISPYRQTVILLLFLFYNMV